MNSTNDNKPDWLDENGMVIYDGRIPEDVRLLDSEVNITLALALTITQIVIQLAIIGLAIYSIVTAPSVGQEEGLENQRGFGFQFQNSRSPTTPLAVCYGEHKHAPHIWYNELSNQDNDNLLKLMWGIGEGPIDSISELKVSDILFTEVDGDNSTDLHVGGTFEKDFRLNKPGLSQDFNDELEKFDDSVISIV